MSLKTIMKIQKWIDDGNYRFSYDYTELINELKEDIAKPDLYDKNDFFSQNNSDFDFDELSSKIYPSKHEFYKHERITIL